MVEVKDLIDSIVYNFKFNEEACHVLYIAFK